MNSPLVWPGGKGLMIKKLSKYIPAHRCYLEPFFGGGSLFFAKPQCAIETINDINSDVVGFFRMLQDEKMFEKFYRKIQLTPYARELFHEAKNQYVQHEYGSLERSYYWFVSIRQSFAGKGGTWAYNIIDTGCSVKK